jgi:hypothetical protein
MIRRNPRRKHWVTIDQEVVRDKRLSWKARGLLAYLLSMDDDWEISVRKLIQESPHDKETALRSAFKELLDTGYARLEFTRNDTNSRASGKRYVIDEMSDRPEGFSEVQKTTISEDSEVQVFSSTEILKYRNSEVQKTCTYKKDLKEKKDLEEKKDLQPSPLTPQGEDVAVKKQSNQSTLGQQAMDILEHLKTVTKRKYRDVKAIAACLREGATMEECLLVIDWWRHIKTVQQPDQEAHFDNVTPFRPSNFDKYRAAALAWHEAGRPVLANGTGAHPKTAEEWAAYLNSPEDTQ